MNIQTFLSNILGFINQTLVPFLLAIAFLVFIWNATRYFIIGAANEDDREKAKSLAVWSIAAFFVIVSLAGIVQMLVVGFGFKTQPQTPDYMCSKFWGDCGSSGL